MSIQFGAAVALRGGAVNESDFNRLDDPEIMKLTDLMKVEADTSFTAADPMRQGTRVEIEVGGDTSANLGECDPAGDLPQFAAIPAALKSNEGGTVMNKEVFGRGLEIRKSVLGTEYVEKSFAAADDFNLPLQELVTEYCWGAVWGREELPKKTRSLLNLAMLSALNRPHELKVHVKGALRNGLSRVEIREVLLQVAIYCGVPAAVDAFRVAREAFAEMDEGK